jgi:predicted DNA binding protein
MREFVITLDYDHGVDPVMDVFIEYPELVSKAVNISVGVDGLTRVDRLSGPPEATEAINDVYLDPDVCNECSAPHRDCDADRSYEVIEEETGSRTIYTYHEGTSFCNSVPYYATKKLTPGLLFDSQRRNGTHEWRILMREKDGVGDLYDTLVKGMPDGIALSFQRLTAPERWGKYTGTIADLPPEQRTAIEAATKMDYYGTPRESTLSDLSNALNVPQSTLRYRLRRAEAWLTDTVITGQQLSDASVAESAD